VCVDVPLSSAPSTRHHLKKEMYYSKFLPKTQSLDIVDEASIANISNENCFESINEEIMMTDPTDQVTAKQTMPKHTPLEHNHGCCSARPIFPNLTYSPYSSPRSARKPAKESRLISIDKNGSFLQLNQYKLMDQIGVVSELLHLIIFNSYFKFLKIWLFNF
jgi:hypothetical protein